MKKLHTLFLLVLSLSVFGHDNEPPGKLSAEQVYLRDLNARLQAQAMVRNEAFILTIITLTSVKHKTSQKN
jgi:hypothetical protein